MISLKISEIHSSDAGKGYARLSENNMDELGITPWDLIEIGGKRKTVVRAMPFENNGYDDEESIIEIDLNTRENAKAEINDFVIVKKITTKAASRVVLSPRNNNLLYSPEKYKNLHNRLDGTPLTVGDKICVNLPGSKNVNFEVLSTTPSNSVVVKQSTKVDVKRKQTVKVDSTRINYEDIGGLDEQIRKIREMIELPLKFPQVFEKLGINPPRGILLIGPPGSGKTLLAKANCV